MALVDDYEAAVRSGSNPAYANYLAKILASGAGININSNDVSAAPANLLPGGGNSTTPAASANGFWGGLWSGIGSIDKEIPLLGRIDSSINMNPNDAGNVISKVGDVVSGTSAAVKFITDIPRVATTLLGLILIIAGIFALARGPAVQIVSSAVKEAVVS